MASSRTGKRTSPNRRRRRTTAATQPSVLLLECDPDRLRADGIGIAGDIAAVGNLMVGDRLEHVRAASEKDLGQHLEQLVGRRFELVVLVGHGSYAGLRLTGDVSRSWSVVGNWLKLFRPKALYAISCEGGSWPAVDQLFSSLGSLQEVVGSPLRTTAGQAGALLLDLAARATGLKVTPAVRFLGQTVNFISTGGVLIRRTRKEWKRADRLAERTLDQGLGLLRHALFR
jgi:hypothetical protein